MLDVTTNIFKPAVSETLQLKGTHDTLGLITQQHLEYSETVVVSPIKPFEDGRANSKALL
jgi:hypothetical protein